MDEVSELEKSNNLVKQLGLSLLMNLISKFVRRFKIVMSLQEVILKYLYGRFGCF